MLGQINFLSQSDLLSGDGVVQVPTQHHQESIQCSRAVDMIQRTISLFQNKCSSLLLIIYTTFYLHIMSINNPTSIHKYLEMSASSIISLCLFSPATYFN